MELASRTRALWGRRSVLGTLVMRDLRVRYAQSWLGYVWTVLDPLLMALIYYLVFVYIFKRGDLGHQPYFLFLIVGLLSWQWFSAALTDCSRALIAEARLVRSTKLPREIWVVRVIFSKGVEYLFSLPVLVAFVLIYMVRGETNLNGWLVLFPLAVLVQTIALIGLGLILAPVTVLVNDMQRVVRIVLRMLFYITPVIYSARLVPPPWDVITWVNPMAGILEMMRAGFFKHDIFPIVWGAIWTSCVVSVVLLLVGSVVFRRLERSVLKEI
jgi:ABC-type polysaccharide/polyol phosphate export permease